MVIYGEYLFLENFLTGGLLLFLTGKLCGCQTARVRFVVGSALCGIYAFSLFQDNLEPWMALFQKLLFSVLLIRLVFGKGSVRSFAGRLSVFYIISFAMGGLTMGIAGLLSTPAASANGSFYVEHYSFLHIVTGCGATALTIWLLLSFIRERLRSGQTQTQVMVAFCGKTVQVEGFVDTGNLLQDPLTGRPVCLLGEGIAGGLLKSALTVEQYEAVTMAKQGILSLEQLAQWNIPGDFHRIPYQGAGGEEGHLLAFQPDYVEVIQGSRRQRYQVILALSRFPQQSGRRAGCQVLLHAFLLGGDLCFGE